MYIPFIILYNTALTDQSSNNHIPLDYEYHQRYIIYMYNYNYTTHL